MNLHLHIICASIPFPADCGSSIDILNRIKAFHKKGVKIHLHYYNDIKEIPTELKVFCEAIKVYKNNYPKKSFPFKTHADAALYANEDLINNLNSNNHPVLFEGLALTGIMENINSSNRKICIRLHKKESFCRNESHEGYSNPLQKIYHKTFSFLQQKKNETLHQNCLYACISQTDENILKAKGVTLPEFIPAFPTWQSITSDTGAGNFCLFHGNLSVFENEKAALWLLTNVFNKIRVPFVIAGKNPSKRLQKAAQLCQHTCLVSNPAEQELNDLVRKAHINILPCITKNYEGVHLKLLHALFEGRHCVATPAIVYGSGLEAACHIGSTANGIASIISQLYYQPFCDEEIKLRERLLYPTYNNENNIQKFIDYLW